MITNIAIQILPLDYEGDKYVLIDRAIAVIQASGLKYQVCPFETVVEGEQSDIFALLERMQQAVYKAGCRELLTNIKIHSRSEKDVWIEEKMEKYSTQE